MAKRIAINGFGRIGRLTLRNLLGSRDVEVVAINDLTDNQTLAHLFKYDSEKSTYCGKVEASDKYITIGKKKIVSVLERNPSKLPWKKLSADIVLEYNGIFRVAEKTKTHIIPDFHKIGLSATSKTVDIKTITLGETNPLIIPLDENHIAPYNGFILGGIPSTLSHSQYTNKLLFDVWQGLKQINFKPITYRESKSFKHHIFNLKPVGGMPVLAKSGFKKLRLLIGKLSNHFLKIQSEIGLIKRFIYSKIVFKEKIIIVHQTDVHYLSPFLP